VRVVPLLGLVLDVRDRDRDPALLLLLRVVDLVEGVKGLTSGILSCSTLVIAAVSVVLPWSMCPMVPMLTCGLVRWNLAFATGFSSLVTVPATSRAGLGWNGLGPN